MEIETQQQQNRRGGARENAGRPRFEPTNEERKQVEAMAGYGVAEAHIASLIRGGIGVSTLRERFKENLEQGRAKAHAGIGKTLFQKAMAGDVASLIWWTKTQMRWTEAPRQIEVSGNISITDALAQAQARLIEAEIVEMDTPLLGVTDAVTAVTDVVTPVTVEYVGGNNGGNVADGKAENAMKSRG
jgi:hypothetical protein